MTVATKRGKTKRKPSRGDKPERRLTRFDLPQGSKWYERVARGLARFRESQGLSVPEAAKKYGIVQTVWYRIEGGGKSATTAKYIDQICEAIKVDMVHLMS